jgi:hypothetical protein
MGCQIVPQLLASRQLGDWPDLGKQVVEKLAPIAARIFS